MKSHQWKEAGTCKIFKSARALAFCLSSIFFLTCLFFALKKKAIKNLHQSERGNSFTESIREWRHVPIPISSELYLLIAMQKPVDKSALQWEREACAEYTYCIESSKHASLHVPMLHLLPFTLSLPLPPLELFALFEQLIWKMRDIFGYWESDVAVAKHNYKKKGVALLFLMSNSVVFVNLNLLH